MLPTNIITFLSIHTLYVHNSESKATTFVGNINEHGFAMNIKCLYACCKVGTKYSNILNYRLQGFKLYIDRFGNT
jgi:hypothetical protein